MKNHPNRNWRRRWTIDLAAATATHADGWVFRFTPADEAGAFDGACIAHPEPLTADHMARATRIAREAGEIYVEARRPRR